MYLEQNFKHLEVFYEARASIQREIARCCIQQLVFDKAYNKSVPCDYVVNNEYIGKLV